MLPDSILFSQFAVEFAPEIEANALSSNLVLLKMTNINITENSVIPVALIVRVCQGNDLNQCMKNPTFHEVVSTYSLFQNRCIWRLHKSAHYAFLYVRIPQSDSGRMSVFLSAYTGGASSQAETILSKATFETRKSGKFV